MRAGFRIGVYREGRKLSKEELKGERDPLLVGIRYVIEFKYLEATKWLQLAKDCYEKCLLLYLIFKALKQEDLEREYRRMWEGKARLTDLEFYVEFPEEGIRIKAEDFYTGSSSLRR